MVAGAKNRAKVVHAIGGKLYNREALATPCGYTGRGMPKRAGYYYDEGRSIPFMVTDDDAAVTCKACNELLTYGLRNRFNRA